MTCPVTNDQIKDSILITKYRVIPGERNCEIETGVWIWLVSYYVL